MELAGIPCEVLVSDVDETSFGEPDMQVKELAQRKARAVMGLASMGHDDIIIAADTLVYIDGQVLGKPQDEKQAFDMLRSLSGRCHTVYTGVAILCGEYENIFADKANVYFHELSDDEIFSYIATGEPFDKAGAYGIQERGSVLVARVEGDFYTVVGLPISKVYRVLTRELGAML